MQRLARQGVAPERIARLVCPIGIAGIESKLPGAIAVAVAAQLQQVLEAGELPLSVRAADDA
jgi:xanthine dehydrogenase accessory factor